MKKLILFLLIQTFLIFQIFCQYDVYTPKGHIVDADQPTSEWDDYWRNYYDNYYSQAYRNATKINTYGGYSTTKKFNCHGYAWHVTEGGEYVWIGDTPYNRDEAIYWEDPNQSYIQIPSQYYPGGKVSYGEYSYHDHSAVVADPEVYGTGWFVSKWGNKVLMRHAYDDSPYPYDSIRFYKLNPNMTGSTSVLCYNVERAFNTDITHMSEATLTWTPSGYITEYSGAGTPQYIVKGSGNGDSEVNFQISTPSGFYWYSDKNFWAGKFEAMFVTGTPDVCPNSLYVYTAQVPYGHSSSYSYEWTYPSGWYKNGQWSNNILLQTPQYNMTYGTVRVSTTNECGTAGPSGITVYPGYCGGYYMAFPNPSSSYVDIDIDPKMSTLIEEIYNNDISLSVYNKMGIVVLNSNVESLPYRIDTSGLPNGEYVVKIITRKKDGTEKDQRVESLKITVNH